MFRFVFNTRCFTVAYIFCFQLSVFANTSHEAQNNQTNPTGIASELNTSIPKIKCDTSDGFETKKEIQKLTLDYLSHLDSSDNKNTASLRDSIKFRLAQLMESHDPLTCFEGIAELSSLCPQLQSDSLLAGQNGTQTLLAEGFKMVRNKLTSKNGAYSKSWKIMAPNGDTAGLASDKDGDGFVDTLVLGGKFKQAMTTTNNTRDIGAGIEWNIKERGVGFEDDIVIDLKSEPYLSTFGPMDTVEKCFGVAGNPATLIALAGHEKGWRPSDAVLTNGKLFQAATLGGWEGLQRGRRGLVVGLKNATVDTVNNTAKGLKSLFWDLPSGAFTLLADPVKREALFKGVSTGLSKLNAGSQMAWDQCLKANENKFVESMSCLHAKILEGSIEGLEKGAHGAGKIISAIGAQLKKCVTEEGAEFGGGEYFAECMGQMTFYTAASAAGGGLYKGGAYIALKGGRMAQITGRSLSIAGEWIVDPIGIATMGPNKLKKLGDVIKETRDDAARLIDSGAKLSREESQQINKYLNEYAKHIADPQKNPLPELNETISKKITDSDPQAIERWQAKVAEALETVSPKYQNATSQILSSSSYHESQKAGKKLPTQTEVSNFMKKIEKNATIKDKDLTLEVVAKINPEKFTNAVQQNSLINFIKEMEEFHSHVGLGKVSSESVSSTINKWSPQALEGLQTTLSDANRKMREHPTLSHAKAIEEVLVKKGATREEIMDVMPCALGHGKN